MSEELKSCSFCGQHFLMTRDNGKFIACADPDCSAYNLWFEREQWQNRPIEYSLHTELQQAKEEIKEIQHGFEIQQTAYVNLLAENKKMREALENIANYSTEGIISWMMKERAKSALEALK
jgi:hypothetical protein